MLSTLATRGFGWKLVADLRRRLDFVLRRALGFALPGLGVKQTPKIQAEWAGEVDEFLALFDWKTALRYDAGLLRIADIGARHFALASRLDERFRKLGFSPELHGIEIDAHRRLADGRTQLQYGTFHAKSVERAEYHALDFVDFDRPLDLALLLHPFVTEEAHTAWGLPLRTLRPRALFDQLKRCLGKKGTLLICSPTEKQKAEALRLAKAVGFSLLQEATWTPSSDSLQKQPRLGMLFAS